MDLGRIWEGSGRDLGGIWGGCRASSSVRQLPDIQAQRGDGALPQVQSMYGSTILQPQLPEGRRVAREACAEGPPARDTWRRVSKARVAGRLEAARWSQRNRCHGPHTQGSRWPAPNNPLPGHRGHQDPPKTPRTPNPGHWDTQDTKTPRHLGHQDTGTPKTLGHQDTQDTKTPRHPGYWDTRTPGHPGHWDTQYTRTPGHPGHPPPLAKSPPRSWAPG